jgi:hypothetical protein
MAEHLVTSKLERLGREAVRLQPDPVLMGILRTVLPSTSGSSSPSVDMCDKMCVYSKGWYM